MKRGGNTMEIGQQIKKYRDQLHLSQEQLADKIYVTDNFKLGKEAQICRT